MHACIHVALYPTDKSIRKKRGAERRKKRRKRKKEKK